LASGLQKQTERLSMINGIMGALSAVAWLAKHLGIHRIMCAATTKGHDVIQFWTLHLAPTQRATAFLTSHEITHISGGYASPGSGMLARSTCSLIGRSPIPIFLLPSLSRFLTTLWIVAIPSQRCGSQFFSAPVRRSLITNSFAFWISGSPCNA